MKNFSSRVAFVTGGASGIGYGLVRNFLRLGMKVVVVDFNRDYVQEVQNELSGRSDVHFVHADVGDRNQMRAAAREMTASWMDPLELGAYVVEGIRNNAPYILTHVEFRDEVRELYEMLDAAFPRQQEVPPERGAFEDHRRGLIRQLRALPVKD